MAVRSVLASTLPVCAETSWCALTCTYMEVMYTILTHTPTWWQVAWWHVQCVTHLVCHWWISQGSHPWLSPSPPHCQHYGCHGYGSVIMLIQQFCRDGHWIRTAGHRPPEACCELRRSECWCLSGSLRRGCWKWHWGLLFGRKLCGQKICLFLALLFLLLHLCRHLAERSWWCGLVMSWYSLTCRHINMKQNMSV